MKVVNKEKKKIMRRPAGTWRKTALDSDTLWREVSLRKSRKEKISLIL